MRPKQKSKIRNCIGRSVVPASLLFGPIALALGLLLLIASKDNEMLARCFTIIFTAAVCPRSQSRFRVGRHFAAEKALAGANLCSGRSMRVNAASAASHGKNNVF
ncbi:MAG: hypothetical protein E5W25_28770 [Mesorhizobium sp.]|nr:MAG: hypothetical protein E5X60_37205 [Mesorhizobium sp.]TIU61520.1 MAG: hypothetical protein E5W25_28770 [Mesorhizobium sp.]